jgi:hypothetical protein
MGGGASCAEAGTAITASAAVPNKIVLKFMFFPAQYANEIAAWDATSSPFGHREATAEVPVPNVRYAKDLRQIYNGRRVLLRCIGWPAASLPRPKGVTVNSWLD